MAEPFLGEVRMFAFNFAPSGWAMCNGQLMPINQNTALFSLLGTMYGGNGTSNFALPNLQGSMPVSPSNAIVQGAAGGEATHTLTLPEIPGHTHSVKATTAAATTGNPAGALWANGNQNNFTTTAPINLLNAGLIGSTGSGLPHLNTPPYLVITFCVALTGIFPSRN